MPIIKIKKRDNPYVMIDRRAISDQRLTWKARGILAYLLSKSDNWDVRIAVLNTESPDGKTAVRSALAELRRFGYATLEKAHGPKGHLSGSNWTIKELCGEPDESTESQVSRLPDLPRVRKPNASKERGIVIKKDVFKGYDIELPFDSLEFEKAWEDWKAYRREAKLKTWTEKTIELRFSMFEKIGESASIEAINNAIANGWQGIHVKPAPGASRPAIVQKENLTAAEIV